MRPRNRRRRTLASLKRVFRILSFRPDPRKEIGDEIDFHFTKAQEELERRGMKPEEARAEAERRFGDMDHYLGELESMETGKMKRARRVEFFRILAQNLRLSVRTLWRAPGFAAGVILTLALGIGANATMFGILDRLLLSPPEHVVNPDQVKRVYLRRAFMDEVYTGQSLTYPDFVDLRAVGAFSSVGAYTSGQKYTLGSGPDAERITGVLASWDFFPTLGVTPRIGRFFSEEEERVGAPLTVILGYGFWQRSFGGDPGVLGRTLTIHGAPMTIIGVAPDGFTGMGLRGVDVWFPLLPMEVLRAGSTEFETSRGWWWLSAVARMAAGAPAEAAEEQATALHRQGRADLIARGRYDPEARILLGSVIEARAPRVAAEGRGNSQVAVARWLSGVSLLVLLIACANVANLLLARAVDRSREVAVRLAMGVSRARLIGQMATETLFLALLGGGAALALSFWGGGIVRRTLLPQVYWSDAGVGVRVLCFTMSVTLLAGVLAGLLPGLQAGRGDVSRVLAGGGRGGSAPRSRTRIGLTVLQGSLSVLLLVGAGLFVKSLRRVHETDLGFEVDQVAHLTLEFQEGELGPPEANHRYAQVIQALGRLPGVTAGARASFPFGSTWTEGITVPGLDSIPYLPGGGPYYQIVDPEYFSTLGLDIRLGRSFTEADLGGDRAVMLVSEAMARALWPNDSPLGKCVRRGSNEESPCVTVVGVVEEASRGRIQEGAAMIYYLPMSRTEEKVTAQGAYIRFTSDPTGIQGTLRRAALEAVPGIRFAEVVTLRERLDPQARSWTLGATMFTVFGLLALLVAGVGLYSVLAYNVARRTRELGIRAAVGAGQGGLVAMIVGEGVRLTVLGIILGVVMALVAGSRVEPLLYQVSPRDPLVFGTVALTLVLVALAASALPALRASRVDPAAALRIE